MKEIKEKILQYLQGSPELTAQIIETIAVLLLLWLIKVIITQLVVRSIKNKKTGYKWKKYISYTIGIISVFAIFQIWFTSITSLATFLGLLSAGIAIALKDPVSDIAAWLYIIISHPFKIGDRIEIGNKKGDVIDIRTFKFTILEIGNWVDADQSTGRVIHIPNHDVFTDSLANYTSDFEFIWNEMQVLITFESDWKKAKKLLQDIVNEETGDFVQDAEEQIKKAEKSYLIEYRYLTAIVYTDIKESGVNLSVRYLTDSRKRRGTAQAIWERVLEEFYKCEDINFAYKSLRILESGEIDKPKREETSN